MLQIYLNLWQDGLILHNIYIILHCYKTDLLGLKRDLFGIIKLNLMKKNQLLLGITILGLSLSSFAFINWNENPINTIAPIHCQAVEFNHQFFKSIYPKDKYPDFFYQLGTRFAGIEKSKINRATSIFDFFEAEEIPAIEKIYQTQFILIVNDRQTDIRELGETEKLNENQLEFLQSLEISSNFILRADFLEKNNFNEDRYDNYATPHWTVVPHQQAQYNLGAEALEDYLRENNKEFTKNMSKKELQPAKLLFTINPNGQIENLRLDRSSGNKAIDKNMLKLMQELPGNWIAAEDEQGNKVAQELTVFFGIPGC